jgi:hypothetical protein
MNDQDDPPTPTFELDKNADESHKSFEKEFS